MICPIRATFENPNFRSFCELEKSTKCSLRGHLFMTSAKEVKYCHLLTSIHNHPKLVLPPPPPPLDVLNWYRYPPLDMKFPDFSLQQLFSLLFDTIFMALISIIKLTGK